MRPVAPIEHAELDKASKEKFRPVTLADNTFALEYKDSVLPTAFRASTVKLSVYVQGCEKSVATVSIRVSYK